MIELRKDLELSDIWVGKTVEKHVSHFGYLIGGICLVIGTLKYYLSGQVYWPLFWLSLGFVLLTLGATSPKALKPVWYYWMKMALALGLFMTSVLILIAWVALFVPIGLLFKLIGKKTIDSSFDKKVTTYWEVRDKKNNDFKLLERQF